MNQVFTWREAPEADFAVIGDPVSHSLSPQMHQAAYDELGLPFRYLAIHVAEGDVSPALDRLASLGYRGINVTVPHKEEVLGWCHGIEPLAARVRAANTVRMSDRACINTDAPGFLETLDDFENGRSLEIMDRALVLGAGGSARALVYALAKQGIEVRLFNRTRSRAEELVDGLGVQVEILSQPDPTGAQLVLNTTSASLQGLSIPIDWSLAPKNALAYDLMYAAEGTPFLREAASKGFETMDGLPLLVAQGALALEWWLGMPAPRSAMMRAIR